MILCITHSQDYYTIDGVQQHLHKLGYTTHRLNTDEFPLRYQFRYTAGINGQPAGCELTIDDTIISSADIEAVWYRKLWSFQIPPGLDTDYSGIYRQEYQTYLHIFFRALSHVPWINKMYTDHAIAENKLQQLQVAQACGLNIPATVMTNDGEAVKKFYTQQQEQVAMKLHGALSRSMSGQAPFFPTTRLETHTLPLLHSLSYCPMIFQAYIEKAYELRIAYIAGECFTGKIDASGGTGEHDWRISGGGAIWQHYQLPPDIADKLHHFMQALDLSFGAIDMIRQPDGQYIFLEVNPQGEWGMLQKYLDYPISETIAEKLVNKIKHG